MSQSSDKLFLKPPERNLERDISPLASRQACTCNPASGMHL